MLGRYMADQLKNSASCDETMLPVEFIAVCVLAFVAGAAATAHFRRSMCCEMEMPGGWTMSSMWRNPLVMIVVAIVIALEKLLRRSAIVARLVGISAIIAGIASLCAIKV